MISPDFLGKLQAQITSQYELREDISNINADGTMYRFDSLKMADKALWICVHSWDYKGNFYYKAIYGSWHDGSQNEFKSYDKNVITKEFNKKEQSVLKESKEKFKEAKKDKQRLCKLKWWPIYSKLPESTNVHSYLSDKGISSNFFGRINDKGNLLIPAYNASGEFVGGQNIYLDPETKKWAKRYTPGIEKVGSFCPFGKVRTAKYIYIAEGFATAASIYMAFIEDENVAVISAWDAGNLFHAALSVRKINEKCNIIFAADRDIHPGKKHDDVGYKKASFASKSISNSVCIKVEFNDGNDSWSDFNDLHCFETLDEVKNQLYVDETDFVQITALGYQGETNYYFNSRKNIIISFTSSDYNQQKFLTTAPERYWADRYGKIYKDGEPTRQANWKLVVEKMATEAVEKGPFNLSQIRGIGAWEEQNTIIVNLGNKLFYKGEYYPLFNNGLNSKYFYEAQSAMDIDMSKPIGEMQALEFVEAFKLLNYKNKSDYIIVLGWLFSSQVFAALKWRPHLWITGSKGTGKSTILEYLTNCVPFSQFIQNSTAAGIRQELNNNAMVTIYDESEPNTKKDREKMEEVLTLARQSSTRSGYKVLRGTSSGNAISYNTNTAFCMGSIQVSSMGGADTSRFFVIEMNKTSTQTHEEFTRLQNAMELARNLSVGLFVRAVNQYDNLVRNIEFTKTIIKKHKIESRQADQLAPIIAGFYGYFDSGLISESFILNKINELNFTESEYSKANEVDDPEQCLQDIMELRISGTTYSVGVLVDKISNEQNIMTQKELNNTLGLIGLNVTEDGELFIPAYSSMLKSELGKISKFSDYRNILKRHEKYLDKGRYNQRWINGKNARGIYIRL